MNKTKSLIATVLGSALAGCGTLEGWPTVADYFTYLQNAKNIPEGWTWEPEGNWYRSPDGKMLWHDGVLIHSIQDEDSGIKDYEVFKKGDHRYSPAYIRQESEARRDLLKIHMQARNSTSLFRRQPRPYNTMRR